MENKPSQIIWKKNYTRKIKQHNRFHCWIAHFHRKIEIGLTHRICMCEPNFMAVPLIFLGSFSTGRRHSSVNLAQFKERCCNLYNIFFFRSAFTIKRLCLLIICLLGFLRAKEREFDTRTIKRIQWAHVIISNLKR